MRVCVLASVVTLLGAVDARADDAKPAPEPRLSSVHPFSGSIGTSYSAVIRGRNLKGANGIEIAGEGVRARVLRVEQEPAEADAKSSVDLVHVQISSDAAALPGTRGVRLLTGTGVTNEVNLLLTAERVVAETDTPELITTLPFVVAGRISQRGEVDTFWLDAPRGQTFTFAVKSGHSSMDPSLALYRRAPTWLDQNHMEQIAFNDEPLFFPGLSTDAHLVHTFREGGKYCVRVQSSTGQGSADAVYQLRIAAGAEPAPALHPKLNEKSWEERQFTRSLSRQRDAELARRGALPDQQVESAETYRASRFGSDQPLPVMRLPGVVEGNIARPAEAHRLKFRVEKAENIAIEIETPEATMPRFNPVVLVFEPGGAEVATNVYTKRNNNGLYMMKMIQPKLTLSLHAPGEYQMEIRDITTDRAGDDFRYRVLVRRQIPHVGRVEVTEDQINLRPGATRELSIIVEREEGFSGLVAFAAEGLPDGVVGMPAAPKPIDKPPLPNGGKLERYTPIVQNSAIVFTAAPEAVPTKTAAKVRIVARPLVNGKLGAPILVKELPLMIVPENGT